MCSSLRCHVCYSETCGIYRNNCDITPFCSDNCHWRTLLRWRSTPVVCTASWCEYSRILVFCFKLFVCKCGADAWVAARPDIWIRVFLLNPIFCMFVKGRILDVDPQFLCVRSSAVYPLVEPRLTVGYWWHVCSTYTNLRQSYCRGTAGY